MYNLNNKCIYYLIHYDLVYLRFFSRIAVLVWLESVIHANYARMKYKSHLNY